MNRVKGLSPADMQLWAAYGQTVPKLMPGRIRLAIIAEPQAAPAPVSPAPKAARKAFSPAASPVGLDKSTWKKFASGGMRATRRLDLHGHTATQAHRAVAFFIEQAHAEGARCIEIITGRGEILARELPHWLNAPHLRERILAMAHPHAANTGSLRILLKRIRA